VETVYRQVTHGLIGLRLMINTQGQQLSLHETAANFNRTHKEKTPTEPSNQMVIRWTYGVPSTDWKEKPNRGTLKMKDFFLGKLKAHQT